MFRSKSRYKNGIPIYGDICTIRIRIRGLDERFDQRIEELTPKFREELTLEIQDNVRKELGPGFDAEVQIRRGSIDIIVIVAAIGTIYLTIAAYKDFAESIKLLYSQLKHLLRRFFKQRVNSPFELDGTLYPEPILAAPELYMDQHHEHLTITNSLIIYLILSNAALVSLLMWLVIRTLV